MKLEPLLRAFGLLFVTGLPPAMRSMRRMNPLPTRGWLELAWNRKGAKKRHEKKNPQKEPKQNYLHELHFSSNRFVLSVVLIGAFCKDSSFPQVSFGLRRIQTRMTVRYSLKRGLALLSKSQISKASCWLSVSHCLSLMDFRNLVAVNAKLVLRRAASGTDGIGKGRSHGNHKVPRCRHPCIRWFESTDVNALELHLQCHLGRGLG